jgi:hypothetical protein
MDSCREAKILWVKDGELEVTYQGTLCESSYNSAKIKMSPWFMRKVKSIQ